MANLLIVDDTVETCNMLAKLFTRCGHTPVCLYSGTAVMAAMRGTRFDLVLLDVMMPAMDGFDVLRAIRAAPEPAVSRALVAMYTAICDPAQQDRARAMGADDWIVKGEPFSVLQRRLDGLLRADRRKCQETDRPAWGTIVGEDLGPRPPAR